MKKKKQRHSFIFFILGFLFLFSVLPFLASDPEYEAVDGYFCSALALEGVAEGYSLHAAARGGKGELQLFRGKGESVEEAFADCARDCDGKLFYATSQLLLLCEGMKKEERLSELCDFLLNKTELQPSLFTAFCNIPQKELSSELMSRFEKKAENSLIAYEARLFHLVEAKVSGEKFFPVVGSYVAGRVSYLISKEVSV